MTLTLTKEIEQGLAKEAERQGTTPEQIALHTLHEHFGGQTTDTAASAVITATSAYDLFAGKIGRLRSEGEGRWSEDTGAKFAEGMKEKRRQGHL